MSGTQPQSVFLHLYITPHKWSYNTALCRWYFL